MYNHQFLFDELQKIEETLLHILERTKKINTVDDFATSPWGTDMLDVACIRLEAVGEIIKKLDKHSEGQLLIKYPDIPWKKIMGMRDFIAHHYFEVDAEVIFSVVKNDVPVLLEVIRQMKKNI